MYKEIKDRLNAALPGDQIKKWHNACLFAIDAALLNDPNFANERTMIQHAPEDIKYLLDRTSKLEKLLSELQAVDPINAHEINNEYDPFDCPLCHRNVFGIYGRHEVECPFHQARELLRETNAAE